MSSVELKGKQAEQQKKKFFGVHEIPERKGKKRGGEGKNAERF